MKKLLALAMAASLGLQGFAAPVEPTVVADGTFAPTTKWYTLQIASAQFYISKGSTSSIPLNRTTTQLADEDLWCFTGSDADGYNIYNKAAGTEKQLCAKSDPAGSDNGGSAYASLRATGRSNFTYLWDFSTSNNLAPLTSYYVNLHGNSAAKLNNRGNKLAFWTAGADHGSSIVISEVYVAVPTIAADGSLSLGEGVSLSGPGATAAEGGAVTLAAGDWTFTSPAGKVVSAMAAGSVSASGEGYGNDEVSFTLSEPMTVGEIRYQLVDQRERPLGQTIFRYDGTPGYTIAYRIPAIVKVMAGPHKGRLIAVNDYRYCGGDIGNGRIDLYQSVSDDNGLTWTEPGHFMGADGKPVAKGTGAQQQSDGNGTIISGADSGFGDAAIVSDRETGEILMVACAGRVTIAGSTRANPQPSARWWSSDGGETWTEPDFDHYKEIYALLGDNLPGGASVGQFIAAGRMVQSSKVKVGSHYRIYCVSGSRNPSTTVNYVLYSDDFGHTWGILGGPEHPAVAGNGNETKCEELPDGSVIIVGRAGGAGRNINIFRYTDVAKAEGSWMTMINTNMGNPAGSIPSCNGDVLIVPAREKATGDQVYLALVSYPAGPNGRYNVSIAYKALRSAADFDEPTDFATVDGQFQVSKISSAYSTMVLSENNHVAFLEEEERTGGRAYDGVFCDLTIEQITGDAFEYFDDADNALALEMTRQMVDASLAALNDAPAYVGAPQVDAAAAAAAADACKANPTMETYAAFNAALQTGTPLAPQVGKEYRLRSAHAYNFGARWLGVDPSSGRLVASQTPDEETTVFTLEQGPEADTYYLLNEASGLYVPRTPAQTKTQMSATDTPVAYRLHIDNALVSLECTDPGNAQYPSPHISDGDVIVIWTVSAQASKWQMELLNPDKPQDSLTQIVVPEADGAIYDLQGRRVSRPANGLYIVNGRKTLMR